MTEKSENTGQIVVQKTFLSVGPTLRYSHNNVRIFWTLAILTYIATLMFWSKLLTGNLISFSDNWADPQKMWDLSQLVRTPIDIFNYPAQIFVLGGLMGIIAVLPVLISQLMSLRHSLLFIICSAIIGLPVGFCLTILVSCFAVACRPLRFRSRIISIALCIAPQVAYWGFFGSSQASEPIRAGLSYAPWICAWLYAMLIAGLTLGIGHYTRYRPGLTFAFALISLIAMFTVFQSNISLSELDYQLYVAGNDPKSSEEFYEHDLSKQLDVMVEQVQNNKTPFGFYPTEKVLLRQRLIRDIQNELRWDRWPQGFSKENKFDFQRKRNLLIDKYEQFITPSKKWWMPTFIHNWLTNDTARQERLPIAIYYKGILSDMAPIIPLIETEEKLKFNTNFPHRGNWQIWITLYKDYSDSPESIEARWRIAKMLAMEGNFAKAEELCEIGLNMADKLLVQNSISVEESDQIFAVFDNPAATVINNQMLKNLKFRFNELKTLINQENSSDQTTHTFLAKFISLNPNRLDYHSQLLSLKKQVDKKQALADNILLAIAMIEPDYSEKQDQLKKITEQYPTTDGGIRAIYELGLHRLILWQQQSENNDAEKEIKNNYLIKAREMLTSFISANPDHFLNTEAQKILNSLPEAK